VAIPVSGGCELVQGERQDFAPTEAPEAAASEQVTFRRWPVAYRGNTVPMLDLDRLCHTA